MAYMEYSPFRIALGKVLIDFVDNNTNYDMKIFTLNGKYDGKSNGFPEANSVERTFKSGAEIVKCKDGEFVPLFVYYWKEEKTEFYYAIYINKSYADWVAKVFNKYIKDLAKFNPELKQVIDFDIE